MRFMHIADCHLGAEPDAGKPWSGQRRQQIWDSFFDVVAYAGREGVDLLLIAGDLFHRQPLKRELKEVAAAFAQIPETEVVLVAGNHDYLHPKSYYRTFAFPENVHIFFGDEVEALYLEELDTTVWGASYWKAEDGRRIYDNLAPTRTEAEWHILLGHGGDEKHHPFQPRKIAEAGFDYAAFGHIHKAEQLVPGKVVMAGSLEPVDCNDFGPHGFWLGDLSEAGCQVHFVPVKHCEYIRQELAVNGQMSWKQILVGVEGLLQERESYQISHIRLLGYRYGDIEIDTQMIEELERVVRVVDETLPDYQFEQIRRQHEGTLLGGFIDTLQQHPDRELARKALYYGVWAMMESMED